MTDTVTTKRTTRITFLGCCNLPPPKAVALRDSMQNIITHFSNLHAACDDNRMKVDDKQKTIKNLTSLDKDVDVLTEMGQAQVDLCANNPTIHQQLQKVYDGINSNSKTVKSLFKSIGGVVHKGIEQEAAQVVDLLLSLVRDMVELLKIADQYTIKKIENMAVEMTEHGKEFVTLTSAEEFADVDAPFAKYSASLCRLVSQRAETIDDLSARASLEQAASQLNAVTPVLLTVTRTFAKDHSNRAELDSNINKLDQATQNILKSLHNAPEFAVMFDVDYLDTELATKLAALAASVKAADPITVAKNSKAVEAEVKKQVQAASRDKSPAVAELCREANARSAQVLKSAKEALEKQKEAPHVAIAAENQLNKASNDLQKAANALPKHTKSSTHLIKAAQELSHKMRELLVS